MFTNIVYIFGMCVLVRLIKTVLKLNEVSGHKFTTAFLIGADSIVFFLVFKNVITNDTTFPIVAAVALGYIVGYFLGAFIEEKVAIGKALVTIKITKGNSIELSKRLRENGFVFIRTKRAYTHKNKLVKIYQGVIFRKELPKLKKITQDLSLIGYIEPVKGTFGKRLVDTKQYLKNATL